MAGKKGNKAHANKTSFSSTHQYNYEKWTKEEAEKLFNSALTISNEDDIYFIGTIAKRLGTYRQIFDYLINKFPIFDLTKKQIDGNIESNLFLAGLTNKDINGAVSIFGLKNNHGWKDKTETDITTNGKDVNSNSVEVVFKYSDFNDSE